MILYVKREDIEKGLKEKAFGNDRINLNEDTMLRGIKVAKSMKFVGHDNAVVYKMGSNEYTLHNREFAKVLKEVMDSISGLVYLEEEDKSYIHYLMHCECED